MRTVILGHVQKSISCGWSCYRALIDTSKLQGPEFQWLRDGLTGPRSIVKRGGPFRMIFVYPCRGGTLLNFVGLFDDPNQDSPGEPQLPALLSPSFNTTESDLCA